MKYPKEKKKVKFNKIVNICEYDLSNIEKKDKIIISRFIIYKRNAILNNNIELFNYYDRNYNLYCHLYNNDELYYLILCHMSALIHLVL